MFQTYLRQTEGVVSVIPTGDAYAVTLDLNPLFGPIPAQELYLSPLQFSLTDLGADKWAYAQDQAVAFKAGVPDVIATEISIARLRQTGVFDATLQLSTSSETEVLGLFFSQDELTGGTWQRLAEQSYASINMRSQAVTNSGGGVDIVARSIYKDYFQKLGIRMAPQSPPFEVAIKFGEYTTDMAITDFRAAGFWQLCAWLAAHPSEAAIKADIDGLKDVVRVALPFFETARIAGKATEIDVQSPFGAGGADSLELEIDLNRVINEGQFREKVAVNGPRLPEAMLPAWVPQFLPDSVTFDISVGGFDPASAIKVILDEPLTPGAGPRDDFADRVADALLPEGTATVTLGPSGAKSALYTLGISGAVTPGPLNPPEGSGMVEVSGLDDVLLALDTIPEEMRATAVPGLMMARGMAKAEGGGKYTWNLEAAPDGRILVNGLDISVAMGK